MPRLRHLVAIPLFLVAMLTSPDGFGPAPAEAAVGCSLNDPEGDLRRFFPDLTDFTINFISFAVQNPSGHGDLALRLEDTLDPVFETLDVPYTLYTVHSNGALLGHVFGSNQRGTYSNLQVIAITGPDLTLRNVYLQKIRSPDYVLFQSEAFLAALSEVPFESYVRSTKCFNAGDCAEFPVPDPTEGRNVEDFQHIIRAIAKLHHLREILLRPDEVIAPPNGRAVGEWIANWWMPERGFLPIDSPRFISVSEADVDLVSADTPVVAWYGDEGVHIYPVNVLSQHPVVHDRLGSQTAAISWSPPGQTVFLLQTKGRTHVFSNTSNTLFGDQTLLDRETQSEWSPALGSAIAGPRIGERLQRVSNTITIPWRSARQLFPHAEVMVPPRDHSRFRRTWAAHRKRYAGDGPQAPRVLVAYSDGETASFPTPDGDPSRLEMTDVGSRPTILVHDAGGHAMFDRRVGALVLDFEMGPQDIARGVTLLRDRQTGSLWRSLTGRAIRGPLAGSRLTSLPLCEMPAANWVQLKAAAAFISNTP